MSTVMSNNRMFVLSAKNKLTATETYLQTRSQDLAHLWNMRYVHLNYSGQEILKKEDMVEGLLEIVTINKNCEECIKGK